MEYPNVCAAEELSTVFQSVCVCVLLAQCQVSLMSLSGAVSGGALPWLSELLQTRCD